MNRSILIVLCDFLLVTLVAFSNFDVKQAPEVAVRPPGDAQVTGLTEDLVGTLRQVLEDEKLSREQLAGSLHSTEQALAEREKMIREFQENLRRTEAQSAQIEQQRAALERQAAAAQTNLAETQSRLAAAANESLVSRERMAALQADLQRREQEARSLQQQLATTEQAMQAALTEKQQLNAQLKVSETEQRLTREQLAELRGVVEAEREEKAKIQQYATALATNVATLARKSGELTQEIREHRPQTANAIYSQFLTNRVAARFTAERSGLLGRAVTRDKTSRGLIFTEGAQTSLLLHVDDTPLTLWNPGADWDRLEVLISRGAHAFNGERLIFLAEDPRVVLVPLGRPQADRLGVQVYSATSDPFKFQEAVIIGATEGYYGESNFQFDPRTPQYVRLDRSFLRGLFGKFNPSRGDLVLSKTGELLGIMVNSDYCLLLSQATPGRSIEFGSNLTNQRTGQILSQLFDYVFYLPARLQ